MTRNRSWHPHQSNGPRMRRVTVHTQQCMRCTGTPITRCPARSRASSNIIIMFIRFDRFSRLKIAFQYTRHRCVLQSNGSRCARNVPIFQQKFDEFKIEFIVNIKRPFLRYLIEKSVIKEDMRFINNGESLPDVDCCVHVEAGWAILAALNSWFHWF